MNTTIENYARKKIKEGLTRCSEKQQKFFKRMYSHKEPDRPIEEVVNKMSAEKLDHALSQVERTVLNNG